MKKTITAVTCACLVISMATLLPLHAQKKEMQITKLPQSTKEFVNMRNELAKTPEGGALMMMMTLMTMDKNHDLGMQFLTILLAKENRINGGVYNGFAPGRSIMYHINRLKRYGKKFWGHTPYAYVKGGTPANKYKVSMPYTIVLSRNKYSGDESKGRVKVFIDCYGVMPRPVTLKRNTRGYWKVYEMSSFFLPVQKPVVTDDGDDL